MYIFLLSIFLLATCSNLKFCTCSQIEEEVGCSLSPGCLWADSRCRKNPNFASNNSNEFNCSNFPQEECRLRKECYFIEGECKQSTICQNLLKNSCDQSSNYCVSDGRRCIDKTQCSSYLTKIACKSKNIDNNYCFWDDQNCRSVESCQELPLSLKTDKECRTEISHCTVAINGGCIDSPQSCEQHKRQSQCHSNYDQKIQCFWNFSDEVCLERLCKNAKYQTQEECQEIQDNCTSDGNMCIDLSDCSQYKTQQGCQYDKVGKACAFVNGECFTKSCATAPESYTLLQQCSQYLSGTQCVPRLNGGCKNFNKTCSEFEEFNTCIQLEDGTECFWNLNKQCKIKECSDAPLFYQYQDCLKWMGNCIGQNTGGCTERPTQCSEIKDPQSCDYDSNNTRCFFDSIENQCKNLICSNLKRPLFNNRSQCQEKLDYCTFSPISGRCFELSCANVFNGCATKTCLNAPKSLDNHAQCEEWNSSCTLNKIGLACEPKHMLCSEYLENQCYNTESGNKCLWKVGQCQDIECDDAPAVSYDTHEKCLFEWIVLQGKCTLAYSGSGCQLWPSTCTGMTQSDLCLIGTVNGESCSWFSNSCQAKTCSNAPDSYKSINQCSKWLINCTFNNSICVDNSTIQCSSMNAFTNHSECYEWNSNCTIASRILEQGCEEKRLCSEYTQQSQCKMGSDGSMCQWNGSNGSCQNLTSCNSIVSFEYSQESCESLNENCTISQITYSCIHKVLLCSDSVIKQECLTTLDDKQCVWNSTLNKCEQSQCEQNTTATIEQGCLKYDRKGYCELKINSDGTYGIGCELRKTSCGQIIEELQCNKTYLQNGSKCYFINGVCISTNCNQFTLATTNEECQSLKHSCQLHPLGTGCVDTSSCLNIPSNACNLVELVYHRYCQYQPDNTCKYDSYGYGWNVQETCTYIRSRNIKLKWTSSVCYYRQCSDVSIPNPIDDENCQEYQSYCRFNGTNGCIRNNYCSDVTNSTICDQATGYYDERFCAWDPGNNVCLSNDLCENQKTAAGVNKDKICHDWQPYYNTKVCVANPNGNGCIQMESCDQIKIYIQCKSVSKCHWFNGLCQNLLPMCHTNTTAISQFECQVYNLYCDLNWNAEKGCNYKACSQVHISQCDSIVLNYGSYCQQSGSQCLEFNYFWNGYYFNPYFDNCNQIQNVKNNDECIAQNPSCQIKLTLNSSSICQGKTCNYYTNQSTCQIDPAGVICYWNGSSCATALGICNDYIDSIICNQSKQLDGESCFWSTQCEVKNCSNINITNPTSQQCYDWAKCRYDQDTLSCVDCVGSSLSICFQQTCSNYSGTNFTLQLCQDWLSSCTSNPLETACIDKVDCKQAPKTFTTHSQCQSYLSQCTIARSQPTCVPLPSSCNDATDIQCYFDASGNKCYWSEIINECITLSSCDQLNLNLSTHSDCNTLLASCTVNQNLHGCISLQNCTDYSQDQCYISLDGVVCTWFDSQCQDKSCITADLVTYTNSACRAYFNSTCSLNELGTQCIESPKTCSEYNLFQCSAPDSQNFYGISCIESISGGCTEQVCENSSLILNTITSDNCEKLSSTCFLLDLCRKQECSDFPSISEEICQQVLPKEPKCTSGPKSCVDRGDCQASISFFSCNFDYKGQQCQWYNDSCILKTCQAAPKNLKSSKECEAYLSGCIPKRFGGCMERTSCPYIEVEEECKIDNANLVCNWNVDEEICQYQECMPFCGDGIISKGFEECDDGNNKPYDGCYKCLYSCCPGCTKSFKSQCQECEIGWRLEDNQCDTVCGDGLVFGKEECDDMNDNPYDGCFKCKFQCDEHCEQCFQGICDKCLYGWKLYDQQCKSTCGDGLLVPLIEQCDDANTIDRDGCSNQCQVEDGWLCSQNQYKITDCLFSNVPKMQLTTTKVGKTTEVLVSFNQRLRFNDEIDNDRQPTEFFVAVLKNAKQQSYQISIIQQDPFLTGQLNTLYFTIQIQFLEPMKEAILQVQLKDVLENQYGQGLSNLEGTLRLQTPQILSIQSKAVAAGAAQFNVIIIYSLAGLSVIGILMGNMDIFWNLLEQLQFLSYLRYINVEYPESLHIFLDIFSVISIQPILDFINFKTFISYIHFGEIPYIESFGKFQEDGINSYFIQNITSTIIVFIIAFMSYYVCGLIIRLLNPISIDCKLELLLNNIKWIDQIKWRTRLLRLCRFILKSCYSSINYFFYSELIRIYISSSYDIIVSLMLQISKPQYNKLTLQVSYYLALGMLFFTLYMVQVFYSIISSPYSKKSKFMSIFQNLKSKNMHAKQYHTFQLIKKISFITALVFLQEIPIIQNLVISMISMVNLIYLYSFRPLEDQYEMLKLLFIEFSVTVNTIGLSLSIVFLSNSVIQAWVNVAIYSTALSLSLGLDIIKYSRRMYKAYMKRKQAIQLQNQIL